jgi:hypothetical protein
MAPNPDISQKYESLYAGTVRRTIAWKDYRGVDWPEKDWFPSIGACELLINHINQSITLKAFLTALREHFLDDQARKFYFVQEECVSGETPRDYQFTIENISEIEGSELYDSNFSSVLFDERYTFALKLHNEGFGYFSGPEKFCESLRENATLVPLISDVQWLT